MLVDIFKGVGIEISFVKEEYFLVVKETLERIGVASKKNNTLYQSCHIFHKQGRYSIMHFKELFLFDGKVSNITENDIQRRNMISKLLEDWGLVKMIPSRTFETHELAPIHQIKIIPSRDRVNWNLVSKYRIGKKFNI